MDPKDKKQLAKQRRETARQAQRFHKEQEKQEKQNKKPSDKAKKTDVAKSKIRDAVNARREKRRAEQQENLSREEKFRRESNEKIRNLEPRDHEEGYFIDEYAEKQKQERRAREIRKQEREVIRRNKKPMTFKQIRLKHILISAGLFTAVLVFGVILCFTVLFKTETINVNGDVYYEKDQVGAFSNVSSGQNLFIGTWNSTPEEIVKNLPYIESAEVSFDMPDTINIDVKNAIPTYAIQNGSGWLVVSSKGRILDIVNYKTDDLVELKCGDIGAGTKGSYIDFGDDSVSDILHSVAKSFADCGVDKVTGFDITNLSSIVISYDNRIDINIGLPEDIEYKIKTAFTIINEKLDPNNTGTIAGTLDVSTCNKNKISRYKPSATVPPTVPAVTEPQTTAPGEQTTTPVQDDYSGYDDSYDDGYDDSYDGYDDGGYDSGYDDGYDGYDDDGGYDEDYGEYTWNAA